MRKDGGAEHPMWCIADKTSRIHMRSFDDVTKLFLRLGEHLRDYVHQMEPYKAGRKERQEDNEEKIRDDHSDPGLPSRPASGDQHPTEMTEKSRDFRAKRASITGRCSDPGSPRLSNSMPPPSSAARPSSGAHVK